MAQIFFASPAERDLKKLPEHAREVLYNTHLGELSRNPRTGKSLHGPLRGYFSYDFGSEGVSYRIAYEIVERSVIILMIDTRDNFYKKFIRRSR